MKASPIPKRVMPALFCLALSLCATPTLAQEGGPSRADPLSEDLMPKPKLSPKDVIRIQLEALRHNDDQDRGIAFRFASPTNPTGTGPLSRFAAMIKEGPYALMLDFRDATYGPVETISGRARQRVTLTDARECMTYWFYLSRQTDGPPEPGPAYRCTQDVHGPSGAVHRATPRGWCLSLGRVTSACDGSGPPYATTGRVRGNCRWTRLALALPPVRVTCLPARPS